MIKISNELKQAMRESPTGVYDVYGIAIPGHSTPDEMKKLLTRNFAPFLQRLFDGREYLVYTRSKITPDEHAPQGSSRVDLQLIIVLTSRDVKLGDLAHESAVTDTLLPGLFNDTCESTARSKMKFEQLENGYFLRVE